MCPNARGVNKRMDWFNTGLYRDLGYGLVYPQVLDIYSTLTVAFSRRSWRGARERTKKWLKILDEHLIGPESSYVCGPRLTLADILGVCMITLGDVIRIDYSAYRNLSRWLATMKAVPYWEDVNDAFYTYFAVRRPMKFRRR